MYRVPPHFGNRGPILKRENIMSVKTDVKVIASKSVSVPLSAVALTVKLTADGMSLVESAVSAAPGVLKAILELPFSSTEGYLIETGVEQAEAQARAYKYVNQPLADTIKEVGVGSGKLWADMLKDAPE